MTHDPRCLQQPRPDGATLVQLDGKPITCQCDLIAQVREDERQQLRAKAQAAYLAAVPARQGRMSAEAKARVAAAALVVRLMTKED